MKIWGGLTRSDCISDEKQITYIITQNGYRYCPSGSFKIFQSVVKSVSHPYYDLKGNRLTVGDTIVILPVVQLFHCHKPI